MHLHINYNSIESQPSILRCYAPCKVNGLSNDHPILPKNEDGEASLAYRVPHKENNALRQWLNPNRKRALDDVGGGRDQDTKEAGGHARRAPSLARWPASRRSPARARERETVELLLVKQFAQGHRLVRRRC